MAEAAKLHGREMHTLKARLGEPGQEALRRDLELWTRHNQAPEGRTHCEAEYLHVVATRS